MSLNELNLFHEEVHHPFFWPGDGAAAPLLVHGFPGTPAEIRPLAETLHTAGWTVQGPLLAGFGPEIAMLFEQRPEQWVAQVRSALQTLRQTHQTVLLVGYSMGGAVALNVAAQDAPDGLILLAPFWQIGGTASTFIWRTLRQFFDEIQLFRPIDFNNPHVQRAFGSWRDVVDLDDAQVQAALHELRVPVRFIDEVLALGQAAKTAAPTIYTPTLVLQGSQDFTITPGATHELLRSLGGQVYYREFAVGHDLPKRETAVFPQVSSALHHFAQKLR